MRRIPEPEYMDLEEEAAAYADADFNEVNEAFVTTLLDFDGMPERPFVLDLGAGPGDIPQRISGLRHHWRVVGLDAAFAMLKRAGQRKIQSAMKTPLWYVLGDAKGLPFPGAAFDVVISNSILHHVADPVAFWLEVKRVAKPGALLFLRDLFRPDSESEAARIVSVYAGTESETLQEEFYRSLLAAYTAKEVREQLDSSGLRYLEVVVASDRHLDVRGRFQQ